MRRFLKVQPTNDVTSAGTRLIFLQPVRLQAPLRKEGPIIDPHKVSAIVEMGRWNDFVCAGEPERINFHIRSSGTRRWYVTILHPARIVETNLALPAPWRLKDTDAGSHL